MNEGWHLTFDSLALLKAISPGKAGIAAFSPRLDEAGNSVRAQRAIAYISEKLKINPYDVEPYVGRDIMAEEEDEK